MRRDWGVTAELIDHVPDAITPLLEGLVLPGNLFVIVGVLGFLSMLDIAENYRSSTGQRPLWSPRLAFIVGVVFGGLALIVALESIFGLSRPPSDWHAIEASPDAFPSGHVMAATVCWGALARWYGTPSKARLVGVFGIIAVVGFGRLALGVHYLPDVLAGAGFGILYLAIVGVTTDESPARAFGVALAIGVVAVLVTGGNTRSVIALAGIGGGTIGWLLLSHGRTRAYLNA